MRQITIVSLFSVALLASLGVQAEEEGFPGRQLDKYKMVSVIELEDLYRRLSDFTVVDARSGFEFDTLRIKGAVNIPVASESFESAVRDLRSQTGKPIAFYCNGHTCMKSYQAAKRAMAAGVNEVYAYDAGIFDWVNAHPDEGELLGKSPVDLAHLIPKKAFKAHLLDADTFSDKATAAAPKSRLILDIRDTTQRAGVGFYPGLERWASLEKMAKLRGYLKKAKTQKRTLYIYDAVGKQVRWLQYEMQAMGLKDYWFMEKGANGYFELLSTEDGLR